MSGDVQEIQTLPREEVERLREWTENYLEDQLEVAEGFAARIERGKKDIEAGNIRVCESYEQ